VARPRRSAKPKPKARSRREQHEYDEKAYRAWNRFERWVARADSLRLDKWQPLVTSSDPKEVEREGEGVMEADELALVPTRELSHSLIYAEETRELVDHMIEELQKALDTRE
jgi:hypothetical protein